MISIIIPAYNASEFIIKTINSVLNQTYKDIEIIVIDDGSTDSTAMLLQDYIKNQLISYIYQTNKGVSATRNLGLSLSKGEAIIFLDADDLLEQDFVSSKIDKLNDWDFVGAKVLSFSNDKNNILHESVAATDNLFHNILFYTPSISTCPSAYLIKRDFLITHNICFNPELSSTADREFLLQLAAKNARGTLDSSPNSAMLYRIVPNSMSHQFTAKLVNDNALFYKEIINKNLIDSTIKSQALKKGYFILYRSYGKLRCYKKALFYFMKYIQYSFIK